MPSTSLSESLRHIRIEKRMTQEDLSTAAGVSRRTISALENEATFVTVNLFSLNKVLEVLEYQLAIAPSRVPTLLEVMNDPNRLRPSLDTRYRVRKTAAEQPEGDQCNSMSM